MTQSRCAKNALEVKRLTSVSENLGRMLEKAKAENTKLRERIEELEQQDAIGRAYQGL